MLTRNGKHSSTPKGLISDEYKIKTSSLLNSDDEYDLVEYDSEAILEAFDLGDEINDEEGRIIGGQEAAKGQFPFVVGLWRKHGSRPFCGGSLITSQ